jgi:hypothetical protein
VPQAAVSNRNKAALIRSRRHLGQAINLLGPAVVDRHVLALDIAGLFEALAECAGSKGFCPKNNIASSVKVCCSFETMDPSDTKLAAQGAQQAGLSFWRSEGGSRYIPESLVATDAALLTEIERLRRRNAKTGHQLSTGESANWLEHPPAGEVP